MIKKIFKENNIKLTKQRKIIYDIVQSSKGFCTSKYILDNCNNNFDKTTLYRVLDLFLEKNIFVKKISLDNEVYYEINSQSHSHYIKCVKCNKKTKIPQEKIELFEHDILNGEDLISHSIEFFVLCSKCKNAAK